MFLKLNHQNLEALNYLQNLPVSQLEVDLQNSFKLVTGLINSQMHP